MVSNIGSEKLVHGYLGKETLTFRVEKNQGVKQGESLTLSIHPDHIHFFQNGLRV
jgi:ABC-type sugar transport system ATPase subunit